MRQPIKFEQEVLSKYGIEWFSDKYNYRKTYLRDTGEGKAKLIERNQVSPEEIAGIAIKESMLKLKYMPAVEIAVDDENPDRWLVCSWLSGKCQSMSYPTYEEAINALIQTIWGN